MKRIRIELLKKRKWEALPENPYPISGEQLESVRKEFAAELASSENGEMNGTQLAPQTTARALLKKAAPHLRDFDLIVLGFAVTAKKVRWFEE